MAVTSSRDLLFYRGPYVMAVHLGFPSPTGGPYVMAVTSFGVPLPYRGSLYVMAVTSFRDRLSYMRFLRNETVRGYRRVALAISPRNANSSQLIGVTLTFHYRPTYLCIYARGRINSAIGPLTVVSALLQNGRRRQRLINDEVVTTDSSDAFTVSHRLLLRPP